MFRIYLPETRGKTTSEITSTLKQGFRARPNNAPNLTDWENLSHIILTKLNSYTYNNNCYQWRSFTLLVTCWNCLLYLHWIISDISIIRNQRFYTTYNASIKWAMFLRFYFIFKLMWQGNHQYKIIFEVIFISM